ncbi:MAG: hypothetical protein DRJ42_25860 [Deltaproteobacteria bacterium]|nr:MAG: hypothetical protein DRJ42_25860 [Deltaproteobacteria bacterium]
MSRQLPIYDPDAAPFDASLVIQRESRGKVPTLTLAVVADGDEDVSALVAAAEGVLGDTGHLLVLEPASVGPAAANGANGARLDELLAEAFQKAEGRVVVAVGPELPARMNPTLLVIVTGGRSLARLSPATRLLMADADLILSEGRPGVGRGLGEALQKRRGLDGI